MKYARARGIRAWLLIKKRGIRRSDPDYYGTEESRTYQDYIIEGDAYEYLLQKSKEMKGLNIFSTGIELMDMLKNSNDDNSYYMIPTGSDLAQWPFVDKTTAGADVYLEYRKIFYKYRFRLKYIFTSHLDCIYAATALGLSGKIVPWCYPAPIEYIEKSNPIILKEFDTPENSPETRILFLPCRKNGDMKNTNYKGTEILIKGIEDFVVRASKKQIRNLFILNIHQGNMFQSYGVENFKNDLDKLADKYQLKVIHIRDLVALEFWGFLKDPRIAVLDEFGQFGGLMGGIGRESCCCGRPLLTGTLSKSDKHTCDYYGSNSPIYTAYKAEEIADFIDYFSKLSSIQLQEKSELIKQWAIRIFDSKDAFNQILDKAIDS